MLRFAQHDRFTGSRQFSREGPRQSREVDPASCQATDPEQSLKVDTAVVRETHVGQSPRRWIQAVAKRKVTRRWMGRSGYEKRVESSGGDVRGGGVWGVECDGSDTGSRDFDGAGERAEFGGGMERRAVHGRDG